MSTRPPSSPPALSGFEPIRLLGSGGFADVFLYQQQHPKRQVAVKVLLKERLGTDTAQGFTEEANLMAQFATHPSIVSVYGAGVATDGRPYLVMEYCSKPNLQVRHRKERFSVADALRIGIQIAGAVETAHRAGILHRDIKPANVLVTEYNRPALTDFGISATTDAEFAGMSVPWSPPESFRMPPQGFPASDVYSLAATVYTLLTNRTPFEVPGASNTEIDVIARIQTMPVPPTGRPEVPGSLEGVLAKAMAKSPADRYASAIEFARALQRVQSEMGMQPTTIDVVEDELAAADEDDDDEGRTRFRGVTSIQAQGPAMPAPAPPVGDASGSPTRRHAPSPVTSTVPASGSLSDQTVVRAAPATPAPVWPPAPELEDTLARPLPPPSDAPAPPRQRRGRAVAWIVGAALSVVVAVVVIALVTAPSRVTEGPVVSPTDAVPVDPLDGGTDVPDVQNIVGTLQGADVVFSWTNPSPEDGDAYLWRPVVPGEEFSFEETESPTATIAAGPAGTACIEVLLVRANGRSADEGVEVCAP